MRGLLLGSLVWISVGSGAAGQATPDLVQQLKSSDARTRRLAAEALGKQKAENSIPNLAELLKDSDAAVRQAAADALVRIGPKAAPALAEALRLPEESSRLAAIGALRRLRPNAKEPIAKEVVPALTSALKDKSIDVRIEAAVVLGQLGSNAKPALPALFEAAKDTSNLGPVLRPFSPSSVTEAAVAACLKIDPSCKEALVKAALPTLLGALKSKDQAVLQAIGFAIAKFGIAAKAALPALREAQKGAKGFASDAINRALTEVGGPAANPLIDVVKDAKAPVEKRLRALSDLRWQRPADEKLVVVLIDALQDPEPRIRAEAVDSLRFMRPKSQVAIPGLLKLLGDPKLDGASSMRRSGREGLIAEALGAMGKEAAPGLAAVLKDSKAEPLARFHAAQALALLGRAARTELAVLKATMKDRYVAIAIESAGAYVRAGGEPKKAVSVLREGLKNEKPFVAYTAAGVADHLGLPVKELVPDLLPLLAHSEPELRIAAARALSKMGPDADPAIPVIAKFLKSENRRLSYQAASILEKFGPRARPALPALIERLDHLDPSSPHPVIVTIGLIGPEAKSAVPALVKLLEGKESIYDRDIMVALGRIGPGAKDAVPALVRQLGKSSEFKRSAAARALGGIGPEAKNAVPDLKKALQDEKKAVRVWAGFALARVTGDSKPQVSMMIELWKDDSANDGPLSGSARFDIAQALELLGPDCRPARDILLEALLNEKTPVGTHLHVARALGQLRQDADTIVPKLVALMERKADRFTRQTNCEHAAEALGLLGPAAKASIPVLHRLREDENGAVADSAIRALTRIEGK